MSLSDDEMKFLAFWVVVFGSAIGFWVILVRWLWSVV